MVQEGGRRIHFTHHKIKILLILPSSIMTKTQNNETRHIVFSGGSGSKGDGHSGVCVALLLVSGCPRFPRTTSPYTLHQEVRQPTRGGLWQWLRGTYSPLWHFPTEQGLRETTSTVPLLLHHSNHYCKHRRRSWRRCGGRCWT